MKFLTGQHLARNKVCLKSVGIERIKVLCDTSCAMTDDDMTMTESVLRPVVILTRSATIM